MVLYCCCWLLFWVGFILVVLLFVYSCFVVGGLSGVVLWLLLVFLVLVLLLHLCTVLCVAILVVLVVP